MVERGNIPVRLTKEFSFEASHRLVNYVGPCAKWHGHTYKLQVTVEGVPNKETGLVMDFKDLKRIVEEHIIQYVDHNALNKTMPKWFSLNSNTTCENMIIAFWYVLDHEIMEKYEGVKLVELKLWETATSHATLTREMIYNGNCR